LDRAGRAMFEQFLKVRYIAIVIVILAVLHALAFLAMGTHVAFGAYRNLFSESPAIGSGPGLELLHSLDFLFISMVLLVLAIGVAKLFLVRPDFDDAKLPSWLRVHSISELKVLVWETVLTTLLIVGLSDLTTALYAKLQWTALIMPIAILILSLSLYYMKRS
jgi:uncharacterized membrane protein YqhA